MKPTKLLLSFGLSLSLMVGCSGPPQPSPGSSHPVDAPKPAVKPLAPAKPPTEAQRLAEPPPAIIEPAKSEEPNSKRDASLISLGAGCTTRYNIQKHYYQIEPGFESSMESNFFDWIFSDEFGEVIQVISWGGLDPKAFQDAFSFENLDFEPEKGHDQQYSVKPKVFRYIRSIHDVFLGPEEKIEDPEQRAKAVEAKIKRDYIDKYNRRIVRLIKKIKEDKPIFFVRWVAHIPHMQPSEKQVRDFHKLLSQIAPNNKHFLIEVGLMEPGDAEKRLERDCRFKFFNLSALPLLMEKPTVDWCHDNRDWKTVFKWIDSVDFEKLKPTDHCAGSASVTK